ncbi:MAG: M20 metallopeptidase family protein [Gemmatimonadota bacterium]
MVHSLLDRATALEADLIALRRHFHQHPELAFREFATAEECARRVEALGYSVRRNVAITGVVAELRNGAGPTIALRADMDALPIHEDNDVDYRSAVDGVMHACGHDTHMTMLIGAAQLLAEAKAHGSLPAGTIRLLFQPSEESSDQENKSGARRMIEDGALDGVDAVFALHIGAHLPAGVFQVSAGPVMAGTDTFVATLRGRSAHAARAYEGVDAIVLAAHVITACQTIVSRKINPFDEGVLSIGMISGGVAENVVADRVQLRGTLRYFESRVRKTIRRELENACEIAEALGGKYELNLRDGYPPVVNDAALTEIARRAIASTVGAAAIAPVEPMMGAEDFALMLEKAPGAFIWLGAALKKPREHHHPEFNIDESVLPKGAAALAAIAISGMDYGPVGIGPVSHVQ